MKGCLSLMKSLKVLRIGSKNYFLDLSLLELRNVKNPHDYFEVTELEAYLLNELF